MIQARNHDLTKKNNIEGKITRIGLVNEEGIFS